MIYFNIPHLSNLSNGNIRVLSYELVQYIALNIEGQQLKLYSLLSNNSNKTTLKINHWSMVIVYIYVINHNCKF